ncbi:murein biosynthesis integral membrane protein MurJ [Adlercreutzia sp. ZJ242]|uniref:murein biosynthesis integral membrane protein MurJ n=1 Tax=Adlercreutzia sp. ZJ242 TaxID=2709409 RepID=UPI001F157166|nr:murein biosynthesis integral membrane protein MurJ [Adlercreutzia sp. ZJ242]
MANTSVARSTALMSIATLGSRATGLIRTWTMAFALGNTLITSAYQVANNMPNVVYELVAGGLLGAAFIPVYLSQKEKLGTKGGNLFACNLLNLCIVVLGVLSILATVFAPQVIATQTFTVSDTAAVSVYATMFFRIFAVQIVFYGIGGVITSILNANRVYFLPSLAPALNNVVVIASFLAYVPLSAVNPDLALVVLAVGTTLGVVVQFSIQIPALAKLGFRWKPRINLHDPALREAIKIAVPTFVYIVGTMVSFSCRNAFSLQAGDNGPSTLIYAWTWYQLPHGVVAVSLSRALFTEMSEDVAKGDVRALRRHITSGVSGTLLLIVPLAGLVGALSTPLMQLFQAGAFNAEDAQYVGSILALWVVSMPFYSVLMYLYNVYASMRKFMTFALVSTVMVAVQCGLYYYLCAPGVLGLAGVPVADLVYYGSCCMVLLGILRFSLGGIKLGAILWKAARTVAATCVGLALVCLLQRVLPFGDGMAGGLATIMVCGLAGLAVIFALCAAFRIPEMAMVTRLLDRFLPSSKKARRGRHAR